MTIDVESWFERRFVSALDLSEDADSVVTVAKVEMKHIENRDGSSERKPVVTLTKPLQPEGPTAWILNKTNTRRIKQVLGTGDPAAWVGKSLALYVDQVDVGGETKDAIRVRTRAPVVGANVLQDADEIPY